MSLTLENNATYRSIGLAKPQAELLARVLHFVRWLDHFGETSYDHQSFFAGPLGRSAKQLYYRHSAVGTLAVSPMIFAEAFLPSARRLFWKPQRFPIADAHYAMGFAYLYHVTGDNAHYRRAVHFLDVLLRTSSPEYLRAGWGYPFDWQTRGGTITAQTPLITSVPYVYEAFSDVWKIDGDERWVSILRAIANHALYDYHDLSTGEDSASCSYTPDPSDPCRVVNASAYRAYMLTRAGIELEDDTCLAVASRNLNYVLNSQLEDGSWPYATDGVRPFIDHFHTCFVLKALAKTYALMPTAGCMAAIDKGVSYYLNHLFDEEGQPKPFARRPRLTVYKNELYDYAECINLSILLQGDFPQLKHVLRRVINLDTWQKPDGSFRSRRLLFGWDNVPMHRWAQSQFFRSLTFYLFSHIQQV